MYRIVPYNDIPKISGKIGQREKIRKMKSSFYGKLQTHWQVKTKNTAHDDCEIRHKGH
jgi:hypothetical protein